MDYDNDYYCEKCGYDIELDDKDNENEEGEGYNGEGGFKTFLTRIASFVF